MVPLPGRARPMASVRQFIELAVNMPAQEPQVGQTVFFFTVPSGSTVVPASIGPPETNTVGMLSRSAAISIPGTTLSQFGMQISALAQCALHWYSTVSAMMSREGRE